MLVESQREDENKIGKGIFNWWNRIKARNLVRDSKIFYPRAKEFKRSASLELLQHLRVFTRKNSSLNARTSSDVVSALISGIVANRTERTKAQEVAYIENRFEKLFGLQIRVLSKREASGSSIASFEWNVDGGTELWDLLKAQE